jgi:hypothetical protein
MSFCILFRWLHVSKARDFQSVWSPAAGHAVRKSRAALKFGEKNRMDVVYLPSHAIHRFQTF